MLVVAVVGLLSEALNVTVRGAGPAVGVAKKLAEGVRLVKSAVSMFSGSESPVDGFTRVTQVVPSGVLVLVQPVW